MTPGVCVSGEVALCAGGVRGPANMLSASSMNRCKEQDLYEVDVFVFIFILTFFFNYKVPFFK